MLMQKTQPLHTFKYFLLKYKNHFFLKYFLKPSAVFSKFSFLINYKYRSHEKKEHLILISSDLNHKKIEIHLEKNEV